MLMDLAAITKEQLVHHIKEEITNLVGPSKYQFEVVTPATCTFEMVPGVKDIPKRFRWRLYNKACKMTPYWIEYGHNEWAVKMHSPITRTVTVNFTIPERTDANE